jgi:hypothetical protein
MTNDGRTSYVTDPGARAGRAVLEFRAGTDQRDEVGCVDGPAPGLC